MDSKEQDEILYRLDERTKSIDEKFDRLDERVEENEQILESYGERLDEAENSIYAASRIVKAIGGGMAAAITGAAAKLAGLVRL